VLQFGQQAQIDGIDFHADILDKSEFNALKRGLRRN
jgi:hypothetical protein